jgi:uncharacterized protein YjgD (DUF1641 family)
MNAYDTAVVDDRRIESLLERISDAAPALEQLLEVVERLSESGVLAGANAVLEDWDELFSAIARPDGMTLVANLMMLMGALSQVRYDAMFDVAMRMPEAVNEGLERARDRTEPLGMLELLRLLRSPGMAGAMTMAGTVVDRMHAGAPPAAR